MQLRSSLPVFFIIIVIGVVFYSLPAVSAGSQFTHLQIYPDYDWDFRISELIPNTSNIIGARLFKKFLFDSINDAVSSKDLDSIVSELSPLHPLDHETYQKIAELLPSTSFDLTLEKIENSAGLLSSPLTCLGDLETHQNSAQAQSSPSFHPAPETNQKHINCDCYQISTQPRLSSSFTASLETLQKHLNYEFQNVVLLRQAMTHSSYSLENNKEFSILGERLIETTVSLRLSTKDLEISLKDLNDKMSEVLKVDTSCAADGMRLGLHNIVRVSSSTDSSTSSVVCDAFRAMLWTIALDSGKCDAAHNVFWAVHGGGGKAI